MLQMPKSIKTMNKQDIALITKISLYISYGEWFCTDKLQAAATVHFLWAKWFVHTCHYKDCTGSNYKAQVNLPPSVKVAGVNRPQPFVVLIKQLIF